MTKLEMFSLKIGQDVLHKRYGVIRVLSVINGLGVEFNPITIAGKKILYNDFGCSVISIIINDTNDIEFITKESVSVFNP